MYIIIDIPLEDAHNAYCNRNINGLRQRKFMKCMSFVRLCIEILFQKWMRMEIDLFSNLISYIPASHFCFGFPLILAAALK